MPEQTTEVSGEAAWAAAESALAAQTTDAPTDAPAPAQAAPEAAQEPEAGATDPDPGQDAPRPENSGAVTPDERYRFREERRKLHARLASDRQELERAREALAEREVKFRTEASGVLEARKMFETGDVEGAVRAAFGVGAPEFNDAFIKAIANRDPRVEAQERRLREFEQRERERAEREATDARARQRQEAEAAWRAERSADYAQSSNPAVRALASDPAFLSTVLEIQKQHWDGVEGLPDDEAAELAVDKARELWNRLAKAFAGPGGSDPEAPQGDGQQAPKPDAAVGSDRDSEKPARPGTVSQRGALEASPRRALSDDEWLSKFSKELAKSEWG